MHCLRCGKECTDGQVFCADCLESTKAYPIKPGTAVQLPERRRDADEKRPQSRHRLLTAEEQLQQLRKTVRSLVIAVVALSLVLGITATLLLHSLGNSSATVPGNLGRNYTAEDSDAE